MDSLAPISSASSRWLRRCNCLYVTKALQIMCLSFSRSLASGRSVADAGPLLKAWAIFSISFWGGNLCFIFFPTYSKGVDNTQVLLIITCYQNNSVWNVSKKHRFYCKIAPAIDNLLGLKETTIK